MSFLMPSVVQTNTFNAHTHPIAAPTTDAGFVHAPLASLLDIDNVVTAPTLAQVTADDVTAGGNCTILGNNCGATNHINAITPRANLLQSADAARFNNVLAAAGATQEAAVTAIPAVTGAPA